MNWDSIANAVGKAAPIVGTILGGPAGGAVGGLIAAALGTDATPEAVNTALQSDPEAFVKLKKFEMDHQERLQQMALDSAATQITQVNQTMRVEAGSDKWWVSGWRPFWGYISALAFLCLVAFALLLTYQAIIEGDITALDMIPQLISSFTGIFSVPAAILGIASWHRGREKRVKAGERYQPGILQSLISKNLK